MKMKTTTTLSLSVVALLFAGCFQVDTTPGKFRCDQPDDTCPHGLACVRGLCVAHDDTGPAAEDLRPVAAPDAAGLSSLGCTGPGSRIVQAASGDVYACRGRFNPGQFASLCRTGFHVCSTADEATLGALELDGRCVGMAGFFAAQVDGTLTPEGMLQCQAGATNQGALLGCGTENATGGGEATRSVAPGCRNLRAVLPCASMATGWSCMTRLQDAAHTDDTRGGVLCCKS